MNVARINEIIRDTTTVYRKGAVVEQDGNATSVYGYPPVAEAPGATVDLVFVAVGVHPTLAISLRDDLVAAIGDFRGPASRVDYRTGPSYIHIGVDLGDQEYALRFMALCDTVNFGKLMTPFDMGFDAEGAVTMAGRGLIYLMGMGYVDADAPV